MPVPLPGTTSNLELMHASVPPTSKPSRPSLHVKGNSICRAARDVNGIKRRATTTTFFHPRSGPNFHPLNRYQQLWTDILLNAWWIFNYGAVQSDGSGSLLPSVFKVKSSWCDSIKVPLNLVCAKISVNWMLKYFPTQLETYRFRGLVGLLIIWSQYRMSWWYHV